MCIRDSYGGDRRATVQVEICKCPGLHPLEVPRIRHLVCSYPYYVSKAVKRLLSECKDIEPLRGSHEYSIFLHGFHDLDDITALDGRHSLTQISFLDCRSLVNFGPLASLSASRVSISVCNVVASLEFRKKGLRLLSIHNCSSLQDVSTTEIGLTIPVSYTHLTLPTKA